MAEPRWDAPMGGDPSRELVDAIDACEALLDRRPPGLWCRFFGCKPVSSYEMYGYTCDCTTHEGYYHAYPVDTQRDRS